MRADSHATATTSSRCRVLPGRRPLFVRAEQDQYAKNGIPRANVKKATWKNVSGVYGDSLWDSRVEDIGTAAPSSWEARDGNEDYLRALGRRQNYNINVDHGQNINFIDSHFAGNTLGKKSDIADGSLRREWEFRTFENICGDYYVSPRFLDAVAMHIVKNYMVELGCIPASVRMPLILGIWGEKGMGKTFQTELAFKRLGVEAVVMSAGELEHEWAGTPGRMIRERYRRAADMSKVRGKFTCLMINDIDAGLGHFENTQITVNNQIVIGTLMNICDHPNEVSVGQDWREGDYCRRTPIVVTGNDLSKIFAPLVRDGRMDKFYWKPERKELVAMLHQMYKDDGLSEEEMGKLIDRFPNQPLDFFGALRSSTYDGQIRTWIKDDVVGSEFISDEANMKELSEALLQRSQKYDLPEFTPVQLTLKMLVEEGERLEYEQEMVNTNKLSHEYLKPQKRIMRSMIGLKG